MNNETYSGLLVTPLKRAIRTKTTWTGFDDSACHLTSRMATENIRELKFECLPRVPYSPDVAPSDYHMFGCFKVVEGLVSMKKAKKQCMNGCGLDPKTISLPE